MEQRRSSKKSVYIIIGLILLGVAVFFGKRFIEEHQQNQEYETIMQTEKSSAESSFSVTQDKKEINNTVITTFIPLDEDGAPIQALADKMTAYSEKVANGTVETATNLVFINATKQDADAAISTIMIEETSYNLVNHHYHKNDPQIIATMYLDKETNELVTLPNVFMDQLAAKQAIFELLIKKTLAEENQEEKQASLSKVFTEDTWQTIPFTLTDDYLGLQLSQVDASLTDETIEWMYLMPIVNEKFTSGLLSAAYNSYQEQLKANEGRKMIALTFDDGPKSTTTGQVLDLLNEYHAKATFFMLGKNVPGNEDLVQRMVAEGHQLANHSYNHPQLTKLTPEEIAQQINDTQAAILKASGGVASNALRPPYGAYNHKVALAAQLPAINWSIDTLDWQSHDPAKINAIVKEFAYSGAIILMHDIHQTTVDALPEMLTYLTSEGYELVTVDELMNHQPLNPMTLYFDQKDSISYEGE
ncbi:polysaccharide deacetylase family protein [Granulicatella balaenopterae]|nr:polysaccharide deacetylase family protein [Granulicatella balaenopterae]